MNVTVGEQEAKDPVVGSRPMSTAGVQRRAGTAAAMALVALLVVVAPWVRHATAVQVTEGQQPTILLIVTDDQRWDTLWAMPTVQQELVRKGVSFTEAVVPVSLCCPSRASILTGRHAHSTGVYRQIPPYGGMSSFDDRSTVATWLDEAGYTNGFFGKYLDAYQGEARSGYVPPGWDRWMAFYHSQFEDYRLNVDGRTRSFGSSPWDYSTTVLGSRAEAFIRQRTGPLFVVYAPAAPHWPATYADRYRNEFNDLPPHRPPSFGQPGAGTPEWLHEVDPIVPGYVDDLRLDQYRSLLSVDDQVADLLDALEDTGRLDRSLVIFTSDNGLQWGEHGWDKKETPYEEAIRVPFVVRDDRVVTVPRQDPALVANVDIAPTIAAAAGVEPTPATEGSSLLDRLADPASPWRDAVPLEHMEGANPIPTFCGVRTARYTYVRYVTEERELYDRQVDPYELDNLAGTEGAAELEAELDARTDELCDPPPPGMAIDRATAPAAIAIALAAGLGVWAAVTVRRRRPPA
ncbi:MAG: sulfatase family protein [Actinomycetota bacterium]